MNILIVDDERRLVSAIAEKLKSYKFNVTCTYDGEQGLDEAMTGIYDVIILDIMMPKLNGYEVLKEIRNNRINTPVLMLSAKSEITDKIDGLNLGADDYLTKPFDTEELLARIKALTRRKAEFISDIVTFGDIELNRDNFEIKCGENAIVLGKKEFQIMDMLLKSNKCIDKERFIEKIWGFDSEAEYNTIEVYITFIRRKLSAIGSTVQIKSVRGLGYILEKQ